MIKEERSIVIRRPVAEVFAFMADQTNAPRWQQGLLEARRTTDDVLDVGTRHVFVCKFLGRRLEAGNEYVEFETDKKIVFKNTSGPIEFRGWYVTEPAGDGTRLTSGIEMRPGGFSGLAEPLIAGSLRREMAGNLAELKDLLESKAVAAKL